MLRVQNERESRHWSRSALARHAELNQVTVGQIEAGRLVPYPSQLKKLARALGWEVEKASSLLDTISDTTSAPGPLSAPGPQGS